jgi:hypothetical protein
MNESIVRPEPSDPLLEETRAFWRDTGKDLVRHSPAPVSTRRLAAGNLPGSPSPLADQPRPGPPGFLSQPSPA